MPEANPHTPERPRASRLRALRRDVVLAVLVKVTIILLAANFIFGHDQRIAVTADVMQTRLLNP